MNTIFNNFVKKTYNFMTYYIVGDKRKCNLAKDRTMGEGRGGGRNL